ncbi:hypothetical protein ABIA32_000632 [Streptacidiphilus sp. MAP12-20]|uniref:hypothetical protein n=1 Tax=Streptacidiphilus sp. MAP12-20 TaxID=3156299 RepID=UPI003513A698
MLFLGTPTLRRPGAARPPRHATTSPRRARLPTRRADELRSTAAPGPTLGEAADDFLARAELDASSRRSYTQTLRQLRLSLGETRPLDDLATALARRTGH